MADHPLRANFVGESRRVRTSRPVLAQLRVFIHALPLAGIFSLVLVMIIFVKHRKAFSRRRGARMEPLTNEDSVVCVGLNLKLTASEVGSVLVAYIQNFDAYHLLPLRIKAFRTFVFSCNALN